MKSFLKSKQNVSNVDPRVAEIVLTTVRDVINDLLVVLMICKELKLKKDPQNIALVYQIYMNTLKGNIASMTTEDLAGILNAPQSDEETEDDSWGVRE